ncbi:MAG: hypothetical protein AAF762_04720 [Pseudomonadota bacterium]
MSDHFTCEICGEEHGGLVTDQAYKLPDEVWAIPEAERSEKARFTDDLYEEDGSSEPRHPGILANALPPCPGSLSTPPSREGRYLSSTTGTFQQPAPEFSATGVLGGIPRLMYDRTYATEINQLSLGS